MWLEYIDYLLFVIELPGNMHLYIYTYIISEIFISGWDREIKAFGHITERMYTALHKSTE